MASQSGFIWCWVYCDGNIITDDVEGVKYDRKMTRLVKVDLNLSFEGLLNLLYAKLWTDSTLYKLNISRRFLNPSTNLFEIAPMFDDDDVQYMFESVDYSSLRNYVELYVEKISISSGQHSNVMVEMFTKSGERSSSSYSSKKLRTSESGGASGTGFPFSSVPPTNPFGSSASSTSPSPLFSFGASQTASSTSSIPTVFGQSSNPTVSVFVPGQSYNPTVPVFGQSSNPTVSVFVPDQSSNPTVPVFGRSSNPTMPVFAFGQSSNPTVPVFGQSSNPAVPVFGQSSNPAVPVFGQSSNPTVPTFGQPLVSQSPAAFTFGSAAPPLIAASPFQFGGQQNQATPQNLPSFQTSNSLVNSGGSFSLGSGGGDKGNRKIVRISKNKNRRK